MSRPLPILSFLLLLLSASTPPVLGGDDDAGGQSSTTCNTPWLAVGICGVCALLIVGMGTFAFYFWNRWLQVERNLKKLVALELALMEYDTAAEAIGVPGRAELTVPACNEMMFLDAETQVEWLTTTILRARIHKVKFAAIRFLMPTNAEKEAAAAERKKRRRETAAQLRDEAAANLKEDDAKHHRWLIYWRAWDNAKESVMQHSILPD